MRLEGLYPLVMSKNQFGTFIEKNVFIIENTLLQYKIEHLLIWGENKNSFPGKTLFVERTVFVTIL